MNFLIISGLSGAGKTRAADMLEDLGYYCVDNMPVALMPRFAELCLSSYGRYDKVALVTDIRERDNFSSGLDATLKELDVIGMQYQILYLDSATPNLVTRYKESRRRHPLDTVGAGLASAIETERAQLAEVRGRADYVIDTSELSLQELQLRLTKLFGAAEDGGFTVNFMSFGYKYAPPIDADFVFDVRFLPNPFYVPELAKLSGEDDEVCEYILGSEESQEALGKFCEFLSFLVPRYRDSGKPALNVSIGCTGGQHRSVCMTRELAKHIAGEGYKTSCTHRDRERWAR
ncbi:MAG: RNase adapter RapZ [Oscillospiraceae bacterium]|jgi:UPF0042 nucleotide-binding protein|nr:RNase adapter RapZ [Oscillospiraceae bacterium]